MGYFPKARHSQNDSENDDGRATGLGRAGRNDGGAAAASMGNRLGIAPARLRGRRRRYARTSPDTIVMATIARERPWATPCPWTMSELFDSLATVERRASAWHRAESHARTARA